MNIVLHEPEIPYNTGNIIRLCANTGFNLHLVRPLGFSLENKYLLRAGLDHHDLARLKIHESLNSCLKNCKSKQYPKILVFLVCSMTLFTWVLSILCLGMRDRYSKIGLLIGITETGVLRCTWKIF